MAGALSDLLKNTLLIVGALFPIVNPIGNAPIFLSLTRGLSSRGRTVLARMIARPDSNPHLDHSSVEPVTFGDKVVPRFGRPALETDPSISLSPAAIKKNGSNRPDCVHLRGDNIQGLG